MEALGLPVPALAVVAFGGWSLVLGVAWLYFRGHILPRNWVDAMRAQDKVIEADLRSRLEDANDTIRVEREQKLMLLHELSPTVTKALGALPKVDQEGP